MKIIFNHTFRSIRENPLQSFALVFTITVMTALFFATLTLGDLFYNLQYQSASRLCGDAEIEISGDIFSEEQLLNFIDENSSVEHCDTFLELTGLLKKDDEDFTEKVVLLEITDLKEFYQKYNDRLTYYQGIDPDTHYSYSEAWMAKDFAENNQIKVGDTVELFVSLYGEYRYFTVTYLFEEKGIFANTAINNILLDVTSVGDRGLINTAFLKLKKEADAETVLDTAKQYFNNPELTIDYAVDYDYINTIVSNNKSLISVILVFVLALVFFILMTSYLLLFQKRTQELYLFKAVGASFAQNVGILLFEGICYGLIGGFLGIVLGRFALSVVEKTVVSNYENVIVTTTPMYIYSILLGVGISLFSSLYPAIKLAKKQNNSDAKNEIKYHKSDLIILLVSAILMVGIILLMQYFPQYTILFSILFLVFTVLFIFFGTPYLFRCISSLFAIKKGIIHLSSFSLKRNKISKKLSSLLGVVIAFSYIAIAIVSIVIDAVTPYQNRFSADYVIQSVSEIDLSEINKNIEKTFGVTGSYYYTYEEFSSETPDKTIKYNIFTVENKEALQNVTQGLSDEEKIDFINSDNGIIISYDMSNRFDKKVGDTIILEMGRYGEQSFTIIAIDTTVTQNDRFVFILSDKKYDFENEMILVTTDKNVSNFDLYSEIRETLSDKSCYILSYNDWSNATTVGLSGISLLLYILQILIGLVSMVGVLNLTVSSFRERTKEFNVFFASGMNCREKLLFHLSEGIMIGLTGGCIGLLFGFLINLVMPTFARLIDRYISVTYFPLSLPIVVLIVLSIYSLFYMLLSITSFRRKIERNIL